MTDESDAGLAVQHRGVVTPDLDIAAAEVAELPGKSIDEQLAVLERVLDSLKDGLNRVDVN